MGDFSYGNLVLKFSIDDELLPKKCQRIENCFKYVAQNLSFSSNSAVNNVKKRITSLELTFSKKWRESEFDSKKFTEKNEEWLRRELQLPLTATKTGLCHKSRGRPKLNDNNSSNSKYRKSVELSAYEMDILLGALVKLSKRNNDVDLSFIFKYLLKNHTNKNLTSEIRQFFEGKRKTPKLDPMKGLAHILDNRLSKSQYMNTKQIMKENGSDIFPAYHKILEAKLDCRPPSNSFKISDMSASLNLQDLLDHTASRLLLVQEEVLHSLTDKMGDKTVMINFQLKWGFDGSSGQSAYNQKFSSPKSTPSNAGRDVCLFATTIVPLRMTIIDCKGTVLWNNLTPQSSRWCRPLKLQFAKETPELTLHEKHSVENEIDGLRPLNTMISGINISISYQLYLTMIDGKVLTTITNTSSNQCCCVCGASPKEFNDLKDIPTRFKARENALKYGISVLHLWIRSFEWLLHISYRIKEKKWQIRGPAAKEKLKNRKLELQAEFYKKMNLRVDFPSTGGSGNSNTGPVARRAFSEPVTLSEILTIDLTLIKRMATILIALSCQLPLDEELFAKFCMDTAVWYVDMYKWFPMPPSIHKVLIHSRDILLASELPVGVLAEDASESCNKLYRHNRQFHARKNNRENNLKDVFNRALDSSDPLIATYGQEKRSRGRRRKNLPPEVLCLLKAPETPMNETVEDLDDDNIMSVIEEALEEVNLPNDSFYEEYC